MRDIDIGYFKELLLDRKKQLISNIDSISKEMNELSNSEVNDDADYASLITDDIIDNAMSKHQTEELKEIEEALKRIEDGSYNVCDMCSEEIGVLRLKVKPYAKYCINCRPFVEKEQQKNKKK